MGEGGRLWVCGGRQPQSPRKPTNLQIHSNFIRISPALLLALEPRAWVDVGRLPSNKPRGRRGWRKTRLLLFSHMTWSQTQTSSCLEKISSWGTFFLLIAQCRHSICGCFFCKTFSTQKREILSLWSRFAAVLLSQKCNDQTLLPISLQLVSPHTHPWLGKRLKIMSVIILSQGTLLIVSSWINFVLESSNHSTPHPQPPQSLHLLLLLLPRSFCRDITRIASTNLLSSRSWVLRQSRGASRGSTDSSLTRLILTSSSFLKAFEQ